MKRLGKKIGSFVLVILLVFSFVSFAFASENKGTNEELKTVIEQAVEWKKKQEGANNKKLFATDFIAEAGKSSADWYAIALGRIGCDEDYFSYLAVLKNNVQKCYRTEEKLDSQKATEWHRIALAALSLGGDPTDMGTDDEGNTIDLIKDGTYDRGKVKSLGSQGINGYIWGLITLDSMRYEVPDGAFDTRESMISAILSSSCSDGGFTLDGNNPDVDITSMALQALAPYYNSEEMFIYNNAEGQKKSETVREAVDRSVLWLSEKQNSEGGFSAWGQENCESTAQVIIALLSLGIDPVNDSRFIKNSVSALDGLQKYRNEDGGFAHSFVSDSDNPTAVAGESNSMATEQALCALSALYRYRHNLRSLYDFRAEQSDELKQQIKELNEKLKIVPDDEDSARALINEYLNVPASERSYVYNYFNLSKALNEYGITYEESKLSAYTGENAQCCGTITDIFSLQSLSSGVKFNENDLNEYLSLPETLTGEYYTVIIKLYEKLQSADNSSEYSDYFAELQIKKDQVEAIQSEIKDINTAIAENLYPFENIRISDKSLINELVEKTEALSEYDRLQILGYEDLIRAKAQVDGIVRSMAVGVLVIALIAACLIFFILHIRKTKQRKKQDNAWKENDEW
ncbi:MAG: hypothetical protein ACI4I3_05680 [Acutalibacteraceae bacterium]